MILTPRFHRVRADSALVGFLVVVSIAMVKEIIGQPYSEFSAGIVDIEAENFSAYIGPRSSHDWTLTSAIGGYSGTGAMMATPNSGSNINTNWTTQSPELQYTVNFLSSGTRYVWLRGYGPTADDDSAHASINGGIGTSAAHITLSQYNVWQWTRTQLGTGNPTTISVPSAGTHTINLYMREDGFTVDRILLTTNNAFSPTPGNAWHIPNNPEPGIASMRYPWREITTGTAVTIYTGNQFQGPGGNPGNQFQTGSAVFWRLAGAGTWIEMPMMFHSESGNNKYFYATFASGMFSPGDVVEYYIRAIYDDHLPTYIYGTDTTSSATDIQTLAQANPFNFTVQAPLTPSGGYVAITSGAFEGRVYQGHGHIELLGPDLNGAPMALSVSLAPPGGYVSGRSAYAGALISSTPTTDGLALVQSFGPGTIQSRLMFVADGVLRYEVTDWGGAAPVETSVRASSPADEHFYGFGEKFNSFDQAGRRVRMLNQDVPGNKGDSSYKVVPWFVSTRGYGFHLGSSAESIFDMRSTHADRFVVTNPDGNLRVDLVGGARLTSVLERWTGLTGRAPVPPEWAFGPWFSTDRWHTGGEVRYAVSKMVALGIPASVLVFDSPWEVGYNDFTWNLAQFGQGGMYEGDFYAGFASVSEMMNFLRTHGLKAVCWMTPFINVSSFGEAGIPGQNLGQSANYAEAAANHYFVRSSPGGPPLLVDWWKGTGSPVDFTNPAATAWLQNQLQALVDGSRVMNSANEEFAVIGGFKTDDGEAVGGANTYIPATAVYFDGRTGTQMRNGYALEYHRAIWNVLGHEGILFARSGFTGSQAYPAYWSGDNEPNFGTDNGLPSVIVASQSAAISGFSMWGSDVGGYIDGNFSINPDDLFRRWAQFGVVTPIMQMHRQVGANMQYPWNYGAPALDNYRECAKLHSRLFPYLMTYAHRGAQTGLPITRPLVLMHQEDPNVWGINHTFYFGDELLAAPVVTVDATARNVYLPAGTWYDFWTNAELAGGQVVNWADTNPMRFPLFVREGSVVPLLLEAPQSLCPPNYVDNPAISTRMDDLDILVYPAGAFGFAMYDGTEILGTKDASNVYVNLTGATTRLAQLRVHGADPPAVSHNTVLLTRANTKAEYDGMAAGWWYDAGVSATWVKASHSGGTSAFILGPAAEPPLGLSINVEW